MKTHETKNWSELAMILTARLRLQYICTGAADKRCAAFLMEIMQRSGEADPAAALSYMVMADSAAGDDVLRYWTALYERGRITEDAPSKLLAGMGFLPKVRGQYARKN